MCTAKGARSAALAERKHKMNTCEFRFHVTGSDRKRLVTAIAEATGCAAKYKGAPTFAYEVDYFTIDKNGTVSFDHCADSDEVTTLVEALVEKGFKQSRASRTCR